MKQIYIDGGSLTLKQIEDVAVRNSRVLLKPETIANIKRSRDTVEKLSAGKKPVYGINTGFGSLSNVKIIPAKINELQLNLIRSHATGLGEPFSEEVARAIMLLRANVLARGYSGVRLQLVQLLIDCINKNVFPIIPKKGSVGASGDLAPLSHLALVLIGEGEAIYNPRHPEGARRPKDLKEILRSAQNDVSQKLSGRDALRKAGLTPIALEAKEGLSLINGTQVMTALGALTLIRAERVTTLADIAGALTIEATRGSFEPFDERIDSLRPYSGSQSSAKLLRELAKGSEINKSHENCGKVQDPYSLRCIPQVHGSVRDALSFIRKMLEIEINAVTDNPIVFSKDNELISGGNFHGQPVSMVLDFLAIALSELGSISERRIEKLMIPEFSQLPPFLTKHSGLHSGFSMVQVTAAALASENKIYSHPASVDSIPTWGDKEDHVSMGVTAAHKAYYVLENVERIIAAELLTAAQGIDFLKPLKPGKHLQRIYKAIRKVAKFHDKDVVLSHEIEAIRNLIVDGTLLNHIGEKTNGK